MRLIAIDMDHTLLKEDKTFDKARCKTYFQKLIDQGDVICIASGNNLVTLKKYFDKDFDQLVYYAADNGNRIMKNNHFIDEVSINHDYFLNMMNYLDSYDDFHPVVTTDLKPYTKQPEDKILDQLNIFFKGYEVVDSYEEVPKDRLITKVSLHTFTASRTKMSEIIEGKFDQITAVKSAPNWMDTYNRNGGKGHAITYLQNKYNISNENTISFGDSLNDASMMSQSKYSVAMSNADPALKELCDYEIGSNEDGAVIDIIELIAKNDNWDFMDEFRKTNKG